MRLRTTFLWLMTLLVASPAWAYRPLNGVSQNTASAPVITRSVSTSLADKDGKLDSNWDTTIVLEQKDAREVARVDVAFSLLGNQNRTILVRRVVLQRDNPWKKGEQWEYRLQQTHLGWPGETTVVQVVSVAFTNGETWDSPEKPEPKLQDVTPDEKENATAPGNSPNSTYVPPIVLPSGSGGTAGSPSSGAGYVPPVRPRVSPARPSGGFSRTAPTTTPPPVPSQAQPSAIPGVSTPGSTSSPSIGTSPNTSPPPQNNPFPGIILPGSSTPVPSTTTSPNPKGSPTPEELMR